MSQCSPVFLRSPHRSPCRSNSHTSHLWIYREISCSFNPVCKLTCCLQMLYLYPSPNVHADLLSSNAYTSSLSASFSLTLAASLMERAPQDRHQLIRGHAVRLPAAELLQMVIFIGKAIGLVLHCGIWRIGNTREDAHEP